MLEEYIDLGLPSGTLWASSNTGAPQEWSRGSTSTWSYSSDLPTTDDWSELLSLPSEVIEVEGYPVRRFYGSTGTALYVPLGVYWTPEISANGYSGVTWELVERSGYISEAPTETPLMCRTIKR